MANSSFTKGTIETPVTPAHGGTGLSTLGTSGQALKVNTGATALEWGAAGVEGVSTFTASTNGALTGGTSPSATTVFDALANGTNDGKFKATIDGTERDNIAVDLITLEGSASDKITQSSYDSATGVIGSYGCGQSFTTGTKALQVASITINYSASWYGGSMEIKTGATCNAGTVLATATPKTGYQGTGTSTWVFPTPVTLAANTQYHFEMTDSGGYIDNYWSTSNPYSGGIAWRKDVGSGWISYSGNDLYFIINGKESTALSTSTIAAAVQAGVRAATGSLETVTYDTNHYVITSCLGGTTSTVSRCSAPTTGTNISGSGTAYLDCATNGTQSYGTGNNGKAALLAGNGKIDGGLVDNSYVSSETKTGTTALTMPATANKAYISCVMYRSVGFEISGDLVIFRTGKTVAYIEGNGDGVAASIGRSFTLSGDTITVADTGSEVGTASYTAYYYK